MRIARARLCTVLLVFTLLAPPLLAAEGQILRATSERGFFALLSHALSGLLPWIEKGRASMDPNGSPEPETEGDPATDGRASMDPNG